MLPFKLIYADGYDLNLGNHVFPAVKFKLIREQCLKEGLAAADDFLEPQPAPDEDILRVHTQEWVRKLKTGKLSPWEIMRLEVPYSPQLVRAFWLSAGGSTLAAQRALTDGCAFNLGGGFHHAYPDHGEGFCAIHDVAVAIRRLQAEGALRPALLDSGQAISTALVVDLDVHHGNGTAAIFAGDATVFTLSMHQENNYPYPKPPSDIDVGLADFTSDETYLRLLRDALDQAFRRFEKEAGKRGTPKPGFIFYLAGADPFLEDQLGGLALTKEGLAERDRIVIDAARSRGIPIAVTFAGGYARRVADTVDIHLNTIRSARKIYATTDAHR
ncbi:MAG: histone deacetylase [Acidobacteria bacterium]|nr:histone deacetylase [Acidobacteriota bacterium]